MSVVDKYQPVNATPRTLSPWGPVYLAAVGLALFLGAFSADTLTTAVTYDEDLPGWERTLLLGVASLGETTGLAPLQRSLDAMAAPLDDTTRVLRKPYKPVVPATEKNVTTAPVPEPTVPPGERWEARKELGRVHRLLLVGASSIQYAIGTELERELRDHYADLEVLRKGKVATGLSRPDVFDWPAEIRRLTEDFHPDVIVGQFGGNDGQNLVDDAGKVHEVMTESWEELYGSRLTEIVQDATAAGARFVMIGMPTMRSDKFTRKIRWLNGVQRRYVEAAGGAFIDIEDLAVDEQGAYQASVSFGGSSGRMRMDDGIHFTRLGGQYMAFHLAHRLEQTVPLVPLTVEGEPPAALAIPLTVPSARRGPTRALAWVPRDVPTEGLPVWYLLHGAWDDWAAWSDHAHDELAQLATAHRVVIVTPDGEPFGYWLDGTVDAEHRIQTWFTEDLMPYVEGVLPINGRRAVSGLSMGGHGALLLAIDHPGMFLAATSMSGAVDLTKSRVEQLEGYLGPYDAFPAAWEQRSVLHRLTLTPHALDGVTVRLSCGIDDPWWWASNEQLHALLDVHGIAHTWEPVPGKHTWDVWSALLPAHAATVSRALYPDETPDVPAAPRPPDPDKNQPSGP